MLYSPKDGKNFLSQVFCGLNKIKTVGCLVLEWVNPKNKNIFMKLMICLNIDEMIKSE